MSDPNLLASKPNPWEMELFWEKHKRRILAGAIILGIAAAGTVAFFLRDYHLRHASKALLARASTAEQLQGVISKYPSSNAAASALLLLAAEQRNGGKLEETDASYQKFLKKFPEHSLAGGAALGLAEDALVAGRLEEGISNLQTLAAKYSTSYVAPFALYTQAVLLAFQPGQTAEAKKKLRDLTQQYPNSICAQQGAHLLALLQGLSPDEEMAGRTHP